MGKSLTQQKRGKGSPTYRVPSFRYKGQIKFAKNYTDKILSGEVLDLIQCQGHSSPMAQIKYENGETILLPAPEGIRVGEKVLSGSEAEIKDGNVLPLKDIPIGTSVFNIESMPGDGGKFVRTSGTAAKILTKQDKKVIVLLPSSKKKTFIANCRAAIGIIAGAGRTEKPFLKAGTRYHKMKTTSRVYPKVQGTSMNAVDHPFGGSSSGIKGRPTQSSRNAPPGRKVGKIAPRRTGRKKR